MNHRRKCMYEKDFDNWHQLEEEKCDMPLSPTLEVTLRWLTTTKAGNQLVEELYIENRKEMKHKESDVLKAYQAWPLAIRDLQEVYDALEKVEHNIHQVLILEDILKARKKKACNEKA